MQIGMGIMTFVNRWDNGDVMGKQSWNIYVFFNNLWPGVVSFFNLRKKVTRSFVIPSLSLCVLQGKYP